MVEDFIYTKKTRNCYSKIYIKKKSESLYFQALASSTALIDDYHKTLLDRSDFGKFNPV